MKLITELTEDVQYISEAKETGEKYHYITGRFITCNEQNRNGRIYESDIVAPEISRYVPMNVCPYDSILSLISFSESIFSTKLCRAA